MTGINNESTKEAGHIKSRPGSEGRLGSTTTGLRRTGLETDRDGLLYVPKSFQKRQPSPLMIMLHGAGADADQGFEPVKEFADQTGTIMLIPESQGQTWDLILGAHDEDTHFIDEALSDVFALYAIDSEKVAIAGFGDGASYALAVGITNSSLFTHILAFSPTTMTPKDIRTRAKVFISHGTEDKSLPIDQCARPVAAALKAAGVQVTLQEFAGGHTIPAPVAKQAFDWFLGDSASGKEASNQRLF